MKKFIIKSTSVLLLVSMFILGPLTVLAQNGPSQLNIPIKKISSSTKIYDRTGQVVLFDLGENTQRILVRYKDISPWMTKAVIAIEDKNFYNHKGVDPKATVRAVIYSGMKLLGLRNDVRVQGGSTITQQVLKNTLLGNDRTLTRKAKEWYLALKLENSLSKDQILEYYLNEIPLGGSMYGVEQGAQTFFHKKSKDLTINEAAYMAAIVNAPTYLSPYGNNRDKLESRKNHVLRNMLEVGYITKEEYDNNVNKKADFQPEESTKAKALHFVQYIREYLESKYGRDAVMQDGLRVITTLDYDIQKRAEEIALRQGTLNEKAYNAKNIGIVAIQPKTGQILAMVGSRNYQDVAVEGMYNVALAKRQPGSSFKPIIYASALEKGFTDNSILFDVPTQFTQSCNSFDFKSENGCYSPGNYDDKYDGAISIRSALAASRNIPAVKMLYLVGLPSALSMAKRLGITSLGDSSRYGLSLVLGGGETSLLEMTGAYSVFANDGVRNPITSILKIEDRNGNTIEQFVSKPETVLDPKVARVMNNILSDNTARTPLFGARSFMYFYDNAPIAAKTGTTNNNRDAWLIGYNPAIAVGVWSGNNNNAAMKKGSAISGPTWRAVMEYGLTKYPTEQFGEYVKEYTGNSYLDGFWKPGSQYVIKSETGESAPIVTGALHSELYYIDKENPRGPQPTSPQNLSLFEHFEKAVSSYFNKTGIPAGSTSTVGTNSLVSTPEKSYLIVDGIIDGESLLMNASHEIYVSFKTNIPETVLKTLTYSIDDGKKIAIIDNIFTLSPKTLSLGVGKHTITIEGLLSDGKTISRVLNIMVK